MRDFNISILIMGSSKRQKKSKTFKRSKNN